MKIIPSNQTLILANERARSGGPATVVPRAMSNAADGVLTRLTLVALQADYSAPQSPQLEAPFVVDAWDGDTVDAGVETIPTGIPARLSTSAGAGASYGSSRGVALYSSTQRALDESPTKLIDVHA
ncbi:MAG: hypothetical protein WB440_17705 [Steroidobacteraceae bacterium]